MLITGALAIASFGALYFVGSTTGCVSSDGAHGFQSLENMDDVSYARMKLIGGIGVKVAASRLLESKQVTPEDLQSAVNVLKSIQTTPVLGTGRELVQALLANSGLSGLEVQSLIELVVFELEARGVLANLTSEGTIALTPRTSDFLNVLTQSMQAAVNGVTPEEVKQAEEDV